MRSTSQRKDHLPASSSASPQHTDPKRRRFLFALGAGSAATAAVAAPAIAAPIASATSPEAPKAKPGYRETEHVRTYYASTRL